MSGAGNDFVVLGPEQARELGSTLPAWVRRVCRRGLSVGADGVLVVTPLGADRVRVRFLNPDGEEAFCGNGTRCAARYASREGMVAGDPVVLETAAGPVEATVAGQSVRLVLPPPVDEGDRTLDVEGDRVKGRHVVAGVPHFVVFVGDVGSAPLVRWGPRLRRHPSFGPAGVNVNVASFLSDGSVALRTWERGVEGETLSCGTGAIAATLAARLAGAAETVVVRPASGVRLRVGLPGPPDSPRCATLEGDARVVFDGDLPAEGTEGFPP